MGIKTWLARNLRRAVGTQQIIDIMKAHAGEIAAALRERGTSADIVTTVVLPPSPSPPPEEHVGAQLIELNGDRLWFPTDLLRYIAHTRVSAPDAAVPQFLAETSHYLWIRERLRYGAGVIDVGANLGLFTSMMATRVKYGLVGWVHAFEPSPRAFRDLGRVLQANGITNVVANNVAVADSCGQASFFDITAESVQREAAHLQALDRAKILGSLEHQIVEVDTVTLDQYTAHHRMHPQLIKIDVEGAEFLVLEGARDTIGRAKPMLVIEYHPDEHGVFDHARLRQFLDELEYSYRKDEKTYYCE